MISRRYSWPGITSCVTSSPTPGNWKLHFSDPEFTILWVMSQGPESEKSWVLNEETKTRLQPPPVILLATEPVLWLNDLVLQRDQTRPATAAMTRPALAPTIANSENLRRTSLDSGSPFDLCITARSLLYRATSYSSVGGSTARKLNSTESVVGKCGIRQRKAFFQGSAGAASTTASAVLLRAGLDTQASTSSTGNSNWISTSCR